MGTRVGHIELERSIESIIVGKRHRTEFGDIEELAESITRDGLLQPVTVTPEEQHGSAPLGWHQDFAEARERLHDWVAACGSRLDRDRGTRQTAWPGEDPAPSVEEVTIEDRGADFRRLVVEDVARRRAVEDAFMAEADDSK